MLSIAAGVSAAAAGAYFNDSLKIAGIVCVVAVAAVEVSRAWRYKQPSAKKSVAIDVPLLSRRSLVFLPASAVLFFVLALVPIPTVEAAILDRKLKQAAKEGRPPYSEVKKLLLFALSNGIVVHSTTLDTTRRTITAAYLALPEKEQRETGVTLAQIAAYDVYARTHVALSVPVSAVLLTSVKGYYIGESLQTQYQNMIGLGEYRTGLIAGFDYAPEAPAVLIYRSEQVRDAIAGYFFAKRPLQRSLANAPAFALIEAGTDHGKVAVIDVVVSNLSQTLDAIVWVNVIFDHCHISYHGGQLLLKDVIFKECEFEGGDVLNRISRFGENPVTLNVP